MLRTENMTATQLKRREKNRRYRLSLQAHDRPLCILTDCTNRQQTKGLCGKHYTRQWKNGRVNLPNADERFWRFVDITSTCWFWTGSQVGKGYGNFRAGIKEFPNKPIQLAHRYVYALIHGGIPEGLEIDHLCNIRHCVNPDHLEAVTRLENMLRSDNHIANLMKANK